MPKFKEVLWAIFAISLASAIVMVAVAPLVESEYADEVRETLSAEAEISESQSVEEGGENAALLLAIILGDSDALGESSVTTPLSIIIFIVGSILRLFTLMGITGLITLLVLAVLSRLKKRLAATGA
ncbi:MAG: hypothetical protein AB8G95_25345 [Anaerolineae bacterium]